VFTGRDEEGREEVSKEGRKRVRGVRREARGGGSVVQFCLYAIIVQP
jgi:hypothetical protein